MEFRDLKKQYTKLKIDLDRGIQKALLDANYILGPQVTELEQQLAAYVGVKHCITCANGTDALSMAVMAWGIGAGDAVFVPDFTFFSSGEIVSFAGAVPIFVDVEEDSFNISPSSLTEAIETVLAEGRLTPKAIISVDLFGRPADYERIQPIAEKYHLKILEDGAQGFGGELQGKKACSFGEIATTSFFPAKPLGCYGDGGAVFTNDDALAEQIGSLRVHGKGTDKYDNVRIGVNSRLDTLQAAVLLVKLRAFEEYELEAVNAAADCYTELLAHLVKTPAVPKEYRSSWAQYSILLKDQQQRDRIQAALRAADIPSMIYYRKPMHSQEAFADTDCVKCDLSVTSSLCERVLSLPMHPYLSRQEQQAVAEVIEANL